MKELLERKYPHHFQYLDTKHNIIFITVCTHQRKPLLANDFSHETLRFLWSESENWLVGRYCILPDHVHLFAKPQGGSKEALKDWINSWKACFSRKIKDLEKPLWQKDFWDTRLRKADSYTAKWEYVKNNPVRHGYVLHCNEWKYQGEIYSLAHNH